MRRPAGTRSERSRHPRPWGSGPVLRRGARLGYPRQRSREAGGDDAVEHERRDRRPRVELGEEPSDEWPEGHADRAGCRRGARCREHVIARVELADGGGDAGHHEPRTDPVHDLAGEETGEARRRGERHGAHHGGQGAGDEQRPTADPLRERSAGQQDRHHGGDVRREQEGDHARAEVVALPPDGEERGGEVAAGEQHHLGGHGEAEARTTRPLAPRSDRVACGGRRECDCDAPADLVRQGLGVHPRPAPIGTAPSRPSTSSTSSVIAELRRRRSWGISASVHRVRAIVSTTSNSGIDSAVAGAVVLLEGFGTGAVLGGDDGPGEQLGVAQRVGEAVGADRVLPVAGVADQRPARAPRPSHVAGPGR